MVNGARLLAWTRHTVPLSWRALHLVMAHSPPSALNVFSKDSTFQRFEDQVCGHKDRVSQNDGALVGITEVVSPFRWTLSVLPAHRPVRSLDFTSHFPLGQVALCRAHSPAITAEGNKYHAA